MKQLLQLARNPRLLKYFLMAVCIVCIELLVFQLAYYFTGNPYLATVVSFVIAVILNWVVGRVLIFGASKHHPAREFSMVLIASVIGLLIQISVVYIAVDVIGLYPLVGKICSIAFSFFWNYWFRARIVYK